MRLRLVCSVCGTPLRKSTRAQKQMMEDIVRVAELVRVELEVARFAASSPPSFNALQQDFCLNIATLKVWIQLQIPRIEDGGNFGVGVQEDIVQELHRAEESSFAFLDQLTKCAAKRSARCLLTPLLLLQVLSAPCQVAEQAREAPQHC